MDYHQQVQQGINFIEERLDEGITLRDVSRAAGVSHWHFLRIFKALTNETLKSYIRTRRLANARLSLLKSRDGILTIALRAGFYVYLTCLPQSGGGTSNLRFVGPYMGLRTGGSMSLGR